MIRTRVGYAGGGAETVELDFDPAEVSYEALVEKFFTFHDATRAPSTGWSISAIFVDGPEQDGVARSVMQRVQAESDGTIQTQILPATDFRLGGESQQKHALQRNSLLFGEFHAMYPDIWDLVDSTAAARVNAYLYGIGSEEQLRSELDGLGLSADARDVLLAASPVAACPVE